MKPKLIIFDLDQTLVEVLPIHDKATEKVFEEVFGKKGVKLSDVDFVGRTAEENARLMCEKHKIPTGECEKNLQKAKKLYAEYFVRLIPNDATENVLPGILDLLQDLQKEKHKHNHLLAVVTGNIQAITDKILESAKLKDYFDFTVCSKPGQTRQDLVAEAVESAQKLAGIEFDKQGVIVIGDSIHDIGSAKPFGAISIAVKTGYHSKEKLLAENPDYYFETLEDTEEIIDIVNLPTREECYGLLEKYHVPKNIVGHIEAVNKIGFFLAKRLKKAGEDVDVLLVDRGTLLHDLCRVGDIEDLSMFKDASPEDLKVWKELQEKCREFGGHGEAAQALLKKEFPKLAKLMPLHHCEHLVLPDAPANWVEKLIAYSDSRVLHDKIIPMLERAKDSETRHKWFYDKFKEKTGFGAEDIRKKKIELEKEIFDVIKMNPEELEEEIGKEKALK